MTGSRFPMLRTSSDRFGIPRAGHTPPAYGRIPGSGRPDPDNPGASTPRACGTGIRRSRIENPRHPTQAQFSPALQCRVDHRRIQIPSCHSGALSRRSQTTPGDTRLLPQRSAPWASETHQLSPHRARTHQCRGITAGPIVRGILHQARTHGPIKTRYQISIVIGCRNPAFAPISALDLNPVSFNPLPARYESPVVTNRSTTLPRTLPDAGRDLMGRVHHRPRHQTGPASGKRRRGGTGLASATGPPHQR